VVYDRGGKGQKQIGNTIVSTPDNKPLKRDSEYQKRKKRNKFRRRAVIEPVIEHLKTDFRMEQNYLHGAESPQIYAFLAVPNSLGRWNMKKMMRELSKNAKSFVFCLKSGREIKSLLFKDRLINWVFP
jgi:IS5 family transposase